MKTMKPEYNYFRENKIIDLPLIPSFNIAISRLGSVSRSL
jgi:hypothetical protein